MNSILTGDILFLISSRVDNPTLEKLSQTTLWLEIREFSDNPYFWFLRVQHLIGRSLTPEISDWKDTYQVLSEVIQNDYVFQHVRTSSVLALKILISLSGRPWKRDAIGMLSKACKSGHIQSVQLILANDWMDEYDADPLSIACNKGYLEIVKMLLADKRMDPNDHSDDLEPPIVEAAQYGHSEIVELLLDTEDIDLVDSSSRLLEVVAENNDIDLMRLLLSHPRMKHLVNSDILTSAVLAKSEDMVRLLLADKRMDPSDTSINIFLSAASEGASLDVMRLLLADERLDPNDCEDLLDEAVGNGCTEIVDLLLQDERIEDIQGAELLQCAARYKHYHIFEMLLADERVEFSQGDVGSILIKSGWNTEIIELLLADSRVKVTQELVSQVIGTCNVEFMRIVLAEPYCYNPARNTDILIRACEDENWKIVALLLDDVRLDPSTWHNTVLYIACSRGPTWIVRRILADKRVNPSDNNNVAMKTALKRGSVVANEIVTLLLKDRRVNLLQLIRDVDLKELLNYVGLKIIRRTTEYKSMVRETDPTYKSLLLEIVLRQSSLEECIDWINKNITDSTVLPSNRAFLLLVTDQKREREDILRQLEIEGSSVDGLCLARDLLTVINYSSLSVEDLYDLLKVD